MSDNPSMVILSEKEVIENLLDGLRESASRARELARASTGGSANIWADIGAILDEMHHSSQELATQKAISRMTALSMLNRRADAAAEKAKQ